MLLRSNLSTANHSGRRLEQFASVAIVFVRTVKYLTGLLCTVFLTLMHASQSRRYDFRWSQAKMLYNGCSADRLGEHKKKNYVLHAKSSE